MSRAAVGAFVALAIATVAAFFVTQHLKVTTPLIAGYPAPVPSTIDPVNGGVCPVQNGTGRRVPTSFRRMRVSFYLLNRADDVYVYIVNGDGAIVDTLPGSGRYLGIRKRRTFTWNGHTGSGRLAPDGVYDIRVALVHQGRSLRISNQNTGVVEHVTVQTQAPHPVVSAVTPDVIATPGSSPVTIHFTGTQGIRPRILIVRAGTRRPLKSYDATSRGGVSSWDGTLAGGRPAPAGRYVVAVRFTDRTCRRVGSPLSAAAAPGAVVTVR